MSATLFETGNLTVRFGGLLAVDDVSIGCPSGELTGLIGPNGAGKTTFIDAVTGFLPKNAAGRVILDDEDVMGWRPHQIAHRGLCRTWQTLELFDDIDVRANLDVASRRLTFASAVSDFVFPSRRDEEIDEVIDLLQLGDVAKRLPRELSQGKRKLVGVGRALVGKPKVLLLDEPAAGLDKAETGWFGDQLRRLVDLGNTMLLVDHDMNLVLRVCDSVQVLVFGRSVANGTPSEIRNDPDVIAAYLGSSGGRT